MTVRERPTRGKFFVSSRRSWESVMEGVMGLGVERGKALEVDKERGMWPEPYHLGLDQNELAALEIEAVRIEGVLDAVENTHMGGGVWRFNGGAASAAHQFYGKMRFFADAFNHLNEKVVTPTALCFKRTDYIQLDKGKVKPDRKHESWHVTSGAGIGISVTFVDLYEYVRRFFYTNIKDDKARELKQCELLDVLHKNANVVISPSHEAFMATRGGNL